MSEKIREIHAEFFRKNATEENIIDIAKAHFLTRHAECLLFLKSETAIVFDLQIIHSTEDCKTYRFEQQDLNNIIVNVEIDGGWEFVKYIEIDDLYRNFEGEVVIL
ncbi:hypothetical protein MKY91_20330 [Alkalicoccobacillus gibsonii]|uniref:DUF960 domain-containing protein n=1 Tax=Alkalicoccobacillus gibsonii TaxID=79881 RepID=A0ABU9VNN0_9BACI